MRLIKEQLTDSYERPSQEFYLRKMEFSYYRDRTIMGPNFQMNSVKISFSLCNSNQVLLFVQVELISNMKIPTMDMALITDKLS